MLHKVSVVFFQSAKNSKTFRLHSPVDPDSRPSFSATIDTSPPFPQSNLHGSMGDGRALNHGGTCIFHALVERFNENFSVVDMESWHEKNWI